MRDFQKIKNYYSSSFAYSLYSILYICILLISTTCFASEQYWQITLSYDSQSLKILEIGKIPAMAKQIRTPGLLGADIKIHYKLTWLDKNGKNLFSTPADIPLGIRAPLFPDSSCETVIPEQGVFVIRVQGPEPDSQPASIRLLKTGFSSRTMKLSHIPPIFQFEEKSLPITKIRTQPAPAAGPISSAKIRDTGSDSNRLVIVVMGDGYTYTNLTAGNFNSNVSTLINAFIGRSPWDNYFNGTNVYRVDIESNEEGADEPPPGPGIYKDTYLNSSFWSNGIERLLTIDHTGMTRARAAADSLVGTGVWDNIFVLVNSTKYGGSGGWLAVSSIHPSASEIILHEYGHTFAGLADEYDYGGTGVPFNDSEPNVDFDYSLSNLKWSVWVNPGTPLPTPQTTSYDTIVGAFEGAKYWTTGIYRPWLNCLMRSLSRPYCPVCKQAIALEYTSLVDLIDSISPSTTWNIIVGSPGVIFEVTPIPIVPMKYEWHLNGNLLTGQSSSSLFLMNTDLSSATTILQVTVTHNTNLIRSTTVSHSYYWTLVYQPTGIDKSLIDIYKEE